MTIQSVSVIICTWNRRESLERTLATLSRQRVPPGCDVEVLVVDNNSTDGTAAVVRERQAGWPLGRLDYLREERQGKQFALNLGTRASRGEILAFTDDDVIVAESWLERALQIFGTRAVDLAGGRTDLVWPDGNQPGWFRSTMLAVLGGVDVGDEPLPEPPSDYAPSGTNLIARRSLFDRVGFYSETHFRHMDYEFGIRARRSGAVVEYHPDLVVYTPVPPEVINRRYFRRWYFKLGIASEMHSSDRSPRLLGIPRWMWRRAAEDGAAALVHALRGDEDSVFDRELRSIMCVGQLCAAWHRALLPRRHQEWVRRWSQKRGMTFG